MSCNQTVVVDPSAVNRQSVGDRLGSDRQPIVDRSATGWRLYLERLFLIAETQQLFGDRSASDRRLVGDQSATKNCVGIVCNRCNWSAISRQPVGDLSATCRRPPKTFLRSIWSERGFTCSNQNLLAATKSSLQPSATGRGSPTSLQPPCNIPATTRNFGRKEVADRLQAMCDRGLMCKILLGSSGLQLGSQSTVMYMTIQFYKSGLEWFFLGFSRQTSITELLCLTRGLGGLGESISAYI